MSNEKEIDSLIEKYLNRQCTPEEEKVLDQWYETMGETRVDYTEEKDDRLEMKLWKAIEKNTQPNDVSTVKQLSPQKARRRTSYPFLTGIAASLAIIVLAGIYFLVPSGMPDDSFAINHPIEEKEPRTITIKNPDSNVVKPVRLEDGSLVVLQPGSEIQYDQPFGARQREVTLSGEAFFEITKDAKHPFLVYTQGLVTKVLGTSFNIKAKAGDKTIVVNVKTGKVTVYREHSAFTEEHLLTPNQQAIYDRDADEILERLQENPQIIVTEMEISEMKFDEAPAYEVFEALEKAYGVDLVYNSTAFSDCSITTSLSNEGLYEKLKIICKALGATYETKETKVLIHGKGCE